MTQFLNTMIDGLVFTNLQDDELGRDGIIYSLYVAVMKDMIKETRLIILKVPAYLATQEVAHASDLMWTTLQTLTLEDDEDHLRYSAMGRQVWKNTSDHDLEMVVGERTTQESGYSHPELPFTVTIRHNPKKKSMYQYPNKMLVSSALNTFQATFTLRLLA